MSSFLSSLEELELMMQTAGATPRYGQSATAVQRSGGWWRAAPTRGTAPRIDMSRFSWAQQTEIAGALEKAQGAFSRIPASVAGSLENEAMVGARLTQVAQALEPLAADSVVATEVVALEGAAAAETATGAAAAGAAALGPVALAAAIVAGVILVGGLVYMAVTSHDEFQPQEKIDTASPAVQEVVDPNFGPTPGHPDLYSRSGPVCADPMLANMLRQNNKLLRFPLSNLSINSCG